MITIKIFDTHCDTAYYMHEAGIGFDNSKTHLSKQDVDKYEVYEQMFAIWSNPKRSAEECWNHFFDVKKHYDKEVLTYKNEKFIPHLTVEGGSLLNNDLSRLDILKNSGVEIMTLVWRDECCMGGAHNTNKGLSSFGKSAVEKMFELGIIPDISHASDKMAYEVFELADRYGKSVIATHSNLRKIRNHTRNMTDDMFLCLMKTGGLSGINYCCDFLEDTDIKKADITSIIRHLEHYLELGGEHNVCLGCDFDGIDELPLGIDGAGSHFKLYEELKKINYSDSLIENIFYNNAHKFFESNI